MTSESVQNRQSMSGINKKILLEDYYKKKANADVDSKENIDGAKFDASEKFASLLKTSSLKELIQIDQKMKNEIKEMDSDMKTLVYENYNKFISASETIHQMKTNVESMEAEMQGLSLSMENISAKSDAINASLETHRTKLEHLSTVNRLLQKLQIVVSLPARLRACLKQQEYALAVGYYCKTRKTLDKYATLPSFRAVRRECAEIMDKVRETLWEELRSRRRAVDGEDNRPQPYPHRISAEAAELALELGEDAAAVRTEWVGGHRAYLDGLVARCAADGPRADTVSAFLSHLDVLQTDYTKIFKDDQCESLLNDLLSSFEKASLEGMRNAVAKGATAEVIVSTLQSFTKIAQDYDSIFPFASLSEKAEDFVSAILSFAISELFQKCEHDAAVVLCQPEPQSGRVAAAAITTDAAEKLAAAITPLSTGCGACLPGHAAELTAAVQLKAWAYASYLDSLLHSYVDLPDHPNELLQGVPVTPSHCLFLYDVSRSLETLVPAMLAAFAERFRSSEVKSGKDELVRFIHETSHKLLAHYALLQGGEIGEVVWNGVEATTWWRTQPPAAPSEWSSQCCRVLGVAAQRCADVLPDSTYAPRATQQSTLFDHKDEYYGKIEEDRVALTKTFVQLTAKAILESCRSCTLNTFGYQQMQVDLQVVANSFTKVLGDSREAEAQLQDVYATIKQRCAEDVAELDAATLIRLSSASIVEESESTDAAGADDATAPTTSSE